MLIKLIILILLLCFGIVTIIGIIRGVKEGLEIGKSGMSDLKSSLGNIWKRKK